jgi:hypothetical protein
MTIIDVHDLETAKKWARKHRAALPREDVQNVVLMMMATGDEPEFRAFLTELDPTYIGPPGM